MVLHFLGALVGVDGVKVVSVKQGGSRIILTGGLLGLQKRLEIRNRDREEERVEIKIEMSVIVVSFFL